MRIFLVHFLENLKISYIYVYISFCRWAAQFNDLIEDTDMRVREYSLRLMEQISKKVGRKMAPHLKVLITPWLLARFDPRSDVQKAAVESFKVRLV